MTSRANQSWPSDHYAAEIDADIVSAVELNQACDLIADLRESFNWHPSAPKSAGLAILTRAQHHIAVQLMEVR